MKKTHHCNEIGSAETGKSVCLQGWVDRRRDHGGVIFIDLRDREGRTQVVFEPDYCREAHQQAEALRNEFVIRIRGTVKPRPEGMVNTKMKTGAVEVYVEELQILNTCEPLPIAINDISEEAVEGEDVLMRYRYLDLRRPRSQRLIRQKSRFLFAWRKALNNAGFDEIETPILMKSTPEGARDFLVPSRLNPGKFYALPQSPQTYKQLLMISGFERYYQVAKCFRDEDLRADRQPEFLQIDCEVAFADCEDIYAIFEKHITQVCTEVWGEAPATPFQRLPYDEAMVTYGCDKPDLRFGLPIRDVTEVAKTCSFNVFRAAVEAGGVVRGIAADGCVDLSRKTIDELTSFVGKLGMQGMVWMRVKPEGVETQVAKFFQPGEIESLRAKLEGKPGDMLFFLAGPKNRVTVAAGQLRLELARLKELTRGQPHKFLWVTDFPLFEYSESEKRWVSLHHPFTSPQDLEMDLDLEKADLAQVKAKAYDCVLNGSEVGGGSIRIHRPELQAQIFRILGLTPEQIERKFGYFVDAFKYGAPPHGGIAFGVDRFLSVMEGRNSIRDFIPFPKTSSGIALMEECPSEVDAEQLRELHIRTVVCRTVV